MNWQSGMPVASSIGRQQAAEAALFFFFFYHLLQIVANES